MISVGKKHAINGIKTHEPLDGELPWTEQTLKREKVCPARSALHAESESILAAVVH